MAYIRGVPPRFEWDAAKAEANLAKHGVSFDEASKLFTSDRDHLEIADEAHAEDEDRFIAIGLIERGVVVVVFTEMKDEVVRIISARKATTTEERLFIEYRGTDHA